jgi:hypothetical protein
MASNEKFWPPSHEAGQAAEMYNYDILRSSVPRVCLMRFNTLLYSLINRVQTMVGNLYLNSDIQTVCRYTRYTLSSQLSYTLKHLW